MCGIPYSPDFIASSLSPPPTPRAAEPIRDLPEPLVPRLPGSEGQCTVVTVRVRVGVRVSGQGRGQS